jgi:EmrB/QacA subfamily drug resistance transporter
VTRVQPPTLEQLRERHGSRLKWLVLLTVLIGMMASVMSTTIINVAVPDMSRYFHLGQERAQWISAGFMVAMTLSLSLTPWLLNRFGVRRTYAGAVLLLMIGGIVGGLSGSFTLMIAMRVTEGLAAGILMPIPNVVIMRAFATDEQGRAMGIFGLGIVLAPAMGPTLGGVLVEWFGWRSIFFVVVPFCLVALLLTRRYLPGSAPGTDEKAPLDWRGLIWLAVGTVSLLNGLVELHAADKRPAAMLIGLGLVALVSFAFYQLRIAAPLFRLRLLAHRQLAMGVLVSFIYGVGLFGSTYLLPLYMQMGLHYSPSQAGLVLMPAGLALGMTMPLAGRMADSLRASRLVASGVLILAASLALMAWVTPATPYLALIACVMLGRVGLGLVLPALGVGSVRHLPKTELPHAVSLSSFARQLGGAIGISMVGIALEWRIGARGDDPVAVIAAFEDAFLMLAAVCASSAVAAWFMEPHRNKS